MKYTQPVHIASARPSAIGRFAGAFQSMSAADLALPVAEAVVPESLRPDVSQVIIG
jgi:hypothetical protein